MTFGQRHDHESDAIVTGEILTVLPIDSALPQALTFQCRSPEARSAVRDWPAVANATSSNAEADLGARSGPVAATHRGRRSRAAA